MNIDFITRKEDYTHSLHAMFLDLTYISRLRDPIPFASSPAPPVCRDRIPPR